MNSAPTSIQFERLALQGARKVLNECIELRESDVLALFWDETTADTAEVILQAARELKD